MEEKELATFLLKSLGRILVGENAEMSAEKQEELAEDFLLRIEGLTVYEFVSEILEEVET